MRVDEKAIRQNEKGYTYGFGILLNVIDIHLKGILLNFNQF
jgi:hypothetical protein